MDSSKPKPPRPERELLDKAKQALQDLIESKCSERASGRFGIVLVLDRGKQAGIRQIIDEARYVS